MAISLLTIYLSTTVYTQLVFGPLDKAMSDAVRHMPVEDEEEEDEEDGFLFIPFPGTTKELKPRPYRGSDPEWQEFIKFSKDQGLAKSVRGEHSAS